MFNPILLIFILCIATVSTCNFTIYTLCFILSNAGLNDLIISNVPGDFENVVFF